MRRLWEKNVDRCEGGEEKGNVDKVQGAEGKGKEDSGNQ